MKRKQVCAFPGDAVEPRRCGGCGWPCWLGVEGGPVSRGPLVFFVLFCMGAAALLSAVTNLKKKNQKFALISFSQLVTAANGAAVVRCRLQHSEGAPGRALHSGNIGVCDIREAAVRERAASTAGNRPLFYFRFGERTPLRETPRRAGGRPPTCRAVNSPCGRH